MNEHGVAEKVGIRHSWDWMISEVCSNLEYLCGSMSLLIPRNGTVPQGQSHGLDLPIPILPPLSPPRDRDIWGWNL